MRLLCAKIEGSLNAIFNAFVLKDLEMFQTSHCPQKISVRAGADTLQQLKGANFSKMHVLCLKAKERVFDS